jgi:heme/copper-type cytochrome/quinol oxidase subunit 2
LWRGFILIWQELNLSDEESIILDTLRKRKEKLDKLENLMLVVKILYFVVLFVTLALLYRIMSLPEERGFIYLIDSLKIHSESIWIVIISIIILQTYQSALNKKIKKQKDKYESLRIETIDLMNTTWIWRMNLDTREKIAKIMKEKFDVNVVYKSKD